MRPDSDEVTGDGQGGSEPLGVPTFPLSRFPGRASRSLKAQHAPLAALFLLVFLDQIYGPKLEFWARVPLWAGTFIAFGLVTYFFVRLLREGLSKPAVLSLESDRLVIRESNEQTISTVPYDRIVSLETTRPWGVGWVLVAEGSLPVAIMRDDFQTGADADRFVRELRRSIAALPDGAARVRAWDQRAAAGENIFAQVPWVSIGTVALLFSVFALELHFSSDGRSPLIEAGYGCGERLLQGELVRLLSPALLHGNSWHLLANTSTLLLLGALLEGLLGRPRLVVLMGLSSVAGSAASAFWAPEVHSVGASAGVFGLLGALLFLNIMRRGDLPGRLRVPGWLLVYLLVAIVTAEFGLVNIQLDHMAHLAGFIAGFTVSAMTIRSTPLPDLPRQASRSMTLLAWVVALAYGGALATILVTATRT